jgi:hypothetical protein
LKLVAKFRAPEFSTTSPALGAGRATANRAFSLLVALNCYTASARVILTTCPYFGSQKWACMPCHIVVVLPLLCDDRLAYTGSLQ